MVKEVVKPKEGFEGYYEEFVARKSQIKEEVSLEFERVLKEKTELLDELISKVSYVVEEEIPDEVVEETPSEENNQETVENSYNNY